MSQSSTTKKAQDRLDSFFKPAQPASISATLSSPQVPTPTFKARPSNFPHPAFTGSIANSKEATPVTSTVRKPSTVLSQHSSYTSSLSPPPNSDPTNIYEIPRSPPRTTVTSSAPGRVVKSSDDEEDDSESSLEDLTTFLQPKHPIYTPNSAGNGGVPSTPPSSRPKTFHNSPMALLTKHKFNLKSLASHAETDRRTEASSKRVKAMQETSQTKEHIHPQGQYAGAKLKHNNLLHSVVADQEGGDVHKVARAVLRTEATLSEHRWYFFDTQTNPVKPTRTPFPTNSISEDWKNDLYDPQIRHHTCISGFAEDMVSFGRALPDEIFLWMLDEICVESSEPLRVSYCNTLKASKEQVERLMMPNSIRKMFEGVGASLASTAVTDRIRIIPALTEPYAKRKWANLRSVVSFLGQIAKPLQPRAYVVSLLLRMCVDRVVLENVDIFDLVQESINRLCICVPDDAWEAFVKSICKTLFNSVDHPTLRLQMVQCTPSVSTRTHDMKRRLAMIFYFNDLSYSTKHSHVLMDLDKFIDRLEDKDFDTNAHTDYRELAALISLLDIAVDDARCTELDLSNPATEKRFDTNIDELGAAIKDIMKSIGNPGAAYVSRIEAKEILDLVSQRISDTLRSKPKSRITVFDRKKEELFDKEKKGMAAFVKKDSVTVVGATHQAPS